MLMHIGHTYRGCSRTWWGVTGGRRKLRTEELYCLFNALDIITVIKSRRVRWAGHVACMGEEEMCVGFW